MKDAHGRRDVAQAVTVQGTQTGPETPETPETLETPETGAELQAARQAGAGWLGLRLARALRRPRAVALSLLVLTLLVLPILFGPFSRLNLRGDLIDLLPRSSEAAQTFATFSRHLSAGQELIVLVTGSDPPALVRFADDYAAALAKHPDVQQVTHRISADSLRYLRDHLLLLLNDADLDELERRVTPAALKARAETLRGLLTAPGASQLAAIATVDPLDLIPLIAQRLSSGLKVDAQSGYLRAADGKALIIKVRPGFAPLDWQRGEKLLNDAGALARSLGAELATSSFSDTATPKVGFTGSYAFPPYYRTWLEQDMERSTVLSVGAVLLLFAVFFRSLRILPVVLLPLGVAGLWTAGAAALLYGRISAVSMAFATILVAIGIDLPIQFYTRLREELGRAGEGADPKLAVRRTAAVLAAPSIVATLGPAAVFFCCGLSDYRGLNQLGVLAGVGLCLNCVAMLTLFPALLLLLPRWAWLGRRPVRAAAEPGVTGRALAALGRAVSRRPRTVLVLAAVLLVLSIPMARRLGFEQRLFAIEPGDMPPARAQAEIARRFGEQQRFLVALIEDQDPERARVRADAWLAEAERLRLRGALRGYESLGTLVPSETTQASRKARLARLDLPQVATRLEQALDAAGFAPEPFSAALSALRGAPGNLGTLRPADLAKTELGFLVRSHLADVPAEADGSAPARRFEALYLFAAADDALPATLAALERFSRGPAGGALTGLPLLEAQLRALVERDMVRVTGASLAAVLVLLALYYRRVRPFVSVFLPLSLAWVGFAGTLAALSIPLNLYNLLAVPLCIGYGIDDHIFLVHRHEATAPEARDPATVLMTTGRAIVLTTLSTMAGFLGLLVAHFEGLVTLGLSGALAVLWCLVAAFLVLPALLSLLWPQAPVPAAPERG